MSNHLRKPLVADWEAVRTIIRTEPWADRLVRQLRPKTDAWIASYRDDARRIAGWGHNYFCKSCVSPLIFDPSSPDGHRCSGCGEINSSPEINEAWTASYRGNACGQVFHAAVWYKLYGDEAYLAYIRKVLDFLSDNLTAFKVNVHAPFEGVFSGINLTDAVAVNTLLKGMELVRDELTEEELEKYRSRFFVPMAEFFCSAPGGTPNISCWMKGAAGMIGLFFDERQWCERAANGFEGINTVFKEGLLPEGFWYESSFHYHLYCAEALTYYNAFCELYDYDYPELRDALLRMYRYPVRFSFPDGSFPSPNDGWPLRSFREYAHLYEWIRRTHDEPAFRYALAQAYDSENDPAPAGGLPRLLFGLDAAALREAAASGKPPRESRHDPDIHYALLQNRQASVFFKYGFVIREHSHADVMNFELYALDGMMSRDISNSGYGTDLFRDWQRRTIAHNTVMVDRLTQPNRPPGRLLEFDAQANRCVATAEDVYPGIAFTRSLQLLDDRLLDEFRIEPADAAGGEEHVFDWLFHCAGDVRYDLPFEPAPLPGDAEGYQLMQNVSRVRTDDDWSVRWVMGDKALTLTVKGGPGTEVYLFQGCEHRKELLRWGVMARRSGRQAKYEAAYRFERV